MLILEAKVREGVKPVVFLDEKASTAQVADAVTLLLVSVFELMEKRSEQELKDFAALLWTRINDL